MSCAAATSLLFVPGSRSDRFARAAASGADVVVHDLEDAVAPEGKAEAREQVRSWLAGEGRGAVRINGAGTPWYDEDVAAVAALECPVMLPKAERPEQVAALVGRLAPGTPVLPLIETAAGIANAVAICGVAGVARPAFGSVDLATQLGVDHEDRAALRYARSALVVAAHAAGVAAPVDGVTTAVRDGARLAADCAEALALGLPAKLCIHPDQIPAVRDAFRPTDEQLRWARAVVDAASAGAVAVLDGALVDRPVVERARALLARAEG